MFSCLPLFYVLCCCLLLFAILLYYLSLYVRILPLIFFYCCVILFVLSAAWEIDIDDLLYIAREHKQIETEVYGLTRGVTGIQHSRVELLKLK